MNAPIFDEIATVSQPGADLTRPWIQPLLLPQDQILASKGLSDLLIYEELLTDSQAESCYQQRFSALTSVDWEVRAGGDRRIDQKAADFIREQLLGIAWDDITEKQLYAVHYGYGVAECLWMRDGTGLVTLDDTREGIRVRNRRRFRFDPDFNLRLITWGNQFQGEVMPDRKFWIFRVGADNHDEPYGKGLGHWLYWPIFFKRNDMKFWVRFLEKFAGPTAVAQYPQGMDETEQNKLLKAAYSLSTAAAVKIPEGAKLALLEAARSGSADYSALWDKMDEAISKVILSQTMTTDNGSSRSQAEVHSGVARRVIKRDADLISYSFNRQVVRWLTDWNFPGAAYPQVWRKVDPPEDLKAQAERDKILFDMGYAPNSDYVVEVYGEGFRPPEQQDGSQTSPLNGLQVQALTSLLSQAINDGWPSQLTDAVVRASYPNLAPDLLDAVKQAIEENQQQAEQANQPQEPIATPDQVASMFGESAQQLFAILQTLDKAVEDRMINFSEIQSEEATLAAIGRRFVTLLQGEFEFAAAKGGKKKKGKGKKNCEKGLSCGATCISKKRICKKNMTASQLAKHNALVKAAKGGGGGAADAQADLTAKLIAQQPNPEVDVPEIPELFAQADKLMGKTKPEPAPIDPSVKPATPSGKITDPAKIDELKSKADDFLLKMKEEITVSDPFSDNPTPVVHEIKWVKEKVAKMRKEVPDMTEPEALAIATWIGTETYEFDNKVYNRYQLMNIAKYAPGTLPPEVLAKVQAVNALAESGYAKLPPITAEYINKVKSKKASFDPNQPLTRSVELPPNVIDYYRNAVGQEITENIHFATTHLNKLGWVEGKNVQFKIVNPKYDGTGQGKYIDHFKNKMVEGEIMYPPGSKFRVKSVTDGQVGNKYAAELSPNVKYGIDLGLKGGKKAEEFEKTSNLVDSLVDNLAINKTIAEPQWEASVQQLIDKKGQPKYIQDYLKDLQALPFSQVLEYKKGRAEGSRPTIIELEEI